MHAQTATFTFKNSMEELKQLPDLVECFGQENELSPRVVFALGLALDELLTNVIQYGFTDVGEHCIRVHLGVRDRRLTVCIEDDGLPFNPLEAPAPELDLPLEKRSKQVGGMGIHLVRHFMDAMTYERRASANVLTLTKQLDDDAGAAPPKE